MRPIEKCYLCGVTENLTNDHLPPKAFFPPKFRENLITVRCCRKCNEGFSMDDEAMLIWLTSVAAINEKGLWVLRNRVAPILKKKTKLRSRVKEHIKIETFQFPTGQVRLPLSYMPDARGDRFMVRLTKGFLRKFYPDYDYSNDTFTAQCAKPFNLAEWTHWQNIMPFVAHTHDSRGDGVIDFWHKLPSDDDMGAWVFLFYRAALFVVWQDRKAQSTS